MSYIGGWREGLGGGGKISDLGGGVSDVGVIGSGCNCDRVEIVEAEGVASWAASALVTARQLSNSN